MTHTTPRVGVLTVLVGPSGAGKTELAKRLVAECLGTRQITCTTRAPRPNEKMGVDYYFLSPIEFSMGQASGFFLESAVVHGHCYGTPKQPVLDALNAGKSLILALDIAGLRQVMSHTSPAIQAALRSYFIYASLETIERRIRQRAVWDGKEVVADELARRLETARTELGCQAECNSIIHNDIDGELEFDAAYQALASAVRLNFRLAAHPRVERRWNLRGWQPCTNPPSNRLPATTPTGSMCAPA